MKKSKLFAYLETLPPRELEKFRRFALSPYLNQHQKTQELLEIAVQELLESDGEYTPQEVFKKLYPKEVFSEQKLHNQLSSLKKLFLRFLALEGLERQPFWEELLILEEASRRNLFDLFSNRLKYLEKQLENYSARDAHYHYAGFRMQNLLGYHAGTFGRRDKSPTALKKMMDHLDRYYLIEKLRHACHLTANSMLLNVQYDMAFLEPILDILQKNPSKYTNDPVVDVYYTILLTLRQEQDERHYLHLKTLLSERFEELSPNAQIDLYRFSNNYCIRKLNLGNNAYQEELFALYKQGLERDLLLDNGHLSEWDYKNIATLGCSLKAFEWTEQFLEQYLEKIPAHRRENAYTFNLANLYFHKKMYSEVQATLLRVQFTDVKYHLNTSFLLLRTYFEEGDTEALYNLIDTLRIYILRNSQITTEEKKGYTNFLHFAKSLISYRLQDSLYTKINSKDKMAALRQKIVGSQNVMHKNWLLEQCQE